MKRLETIQQFVRDFFVIFGILIIGSVFLTPPETITRDYVLLAMAFAVAGNLPSLVFWSKSELTEHSRRLRYIIHLILLEAIILMFGGLAGLVSTLSDYVFFAIEIFVIYVIVRVITWSGDVATAKKINEKLKSMKLSDSE